MARQLFLCVTRTRAGELYTCAHACVYARVRVRVCVFVRARVHACERMCVHARVRVYVLLTYHNQCLYCRPYSRRFRFTIRHAEWVQTSLKVTNVCGSVRFYRWMVLFGIEASVTDIGVCLVVDLWKRA